MTETPDEIMRRMILATLEQCGPCHIGYFPAATQNDLVELLEAEYKKTLMGFDLETVDWALTQLIDERIVINRHGDWEFEEHYRLAPKKSAPRNESLLFKETDQ